MIVNVKSWYAITILMGSTKSSILTIASKLLFWDSSIEWPIPLDKMTSWLFCWTELHSELQYDQEGFGNFIWRECFESETWYDSLQTVDKSCALGIHDNDDALWDETVSISSKNEDGNWVEFAMGEIASTGTCWIPYRLKRLQAVGPTKKST